MDHQRVVLFGNDDDGGFCHLSRLRGRSYRIERCDTGGGNSLYTNSATRGGTPTPTLPRKRERESIQDFNRRAAVGRKLPLDAVDGQAWQKQAENSPVR